MMNEQTLLNQVTFKLKTVQNGRFIVDIVQVKDGGKLCHAGSQASYETIEEAIEQGLKYVSRYLKPTATLPEGEDDV
jgi:hypothetical protein